MLGVGSFPVPPFSVPPFDDSFAVSFAVSPEVPPTVWSSPAPTPSGAGPRSAGSTAQVTASSWVASRIRSIRLPGPAPLVQACARASPVALTSSGRGSRVSGATTATSRGWYSLRVWKGRNVAWVAASGAPGTLLVPELPELPEALGRLDGLAVPGTGVPGVAGVAEVPGGAEVAGASGAGTA